MIDYSPLWHTMEEKQISQYVLLKSGIDHKTLDRLKKNSNITALTLEKLCLILDCQPNDVITLYKNSFNKLFFILPISSYILSI